MGHPSERKKTTIERGLPLLLLFSKSSITTSSESRLRMEPLRMACRGLEALATSDGFPEKIVDAQPQSVSSFKVDFSCVIGNCRGDGRFLLEVTVRDPFLDRVGWFSENAAAFCLGADNANRRKAASLILLVTV